MNIQDQTPGNAVRHKKSFAQEKALTANPYVTKSMLSDLRTDSSSSRIKIFLLFLTFAPYIPSLTFKFIIGATKN